MFKEIGAQIRPAILALILFTIITGAIYPAIVTGISQAAFKHQANGSIIEKNGQTVGSTLIGQQFTDPKYFWGRLSGTSKPYDASNSSGSNLGPTNTALLDAVKGRIKSLQDADPGNKQAVPVDLVTASGSGLDPHISPAAAEYQVSRVAKARKLDESKVKALIDQFTENRLLGVLGDPHVNVLELNLALDAISTPVENAKAK